MTENQHESRLYAYSPMNSHERYLLTLMDSLIGALDSLQADSAMRQMWLETQWLKQNLLNAKLVLPAWQLLIYKPPIELSAHPEVQRFAKQLASELTKYCDSSRVAASRQQENCQ